MHYDPADPDNNYLVDASKVKYIAGSLCGALFMLIGVLSLTGKLIGKK